jgi:hypothetical protein
MAMPSSALAVNAAPRASASASLSGSSKPPAHATLCKSSDEKTKLHAHRRDQRFEGMAPRALSAAAIAVKRLPSLPRRVARHLGATTCRAFSAI